MLTLFTAPKPFFGHIEMIQRNAIQSWLKLGKEVQVMVMGDEQGIGEVAEEFSLIHVPEVDTNREGTPLLDSIFRQAHLRGGDSTLCYLNADILLLEGFKEAVDRVRDFFEHFLMVSQRWDLDITEPISFQDGWRDRIRQQVSARGNLHPPAGSDLFVFDSKSFRKIPPFALGRSGWDNWMIFAGRKMGIPVIDATQAITIVHQNHDYRHLPGGQPHFRLPESDENRRLAGGRQNMFTLQDATWKLTPQTLEKKGISESGWLRNLEAGLIARSGGGKLSRAVWFLFHPLDTFHYYRKAFPRRLARVMRKDRGSVEEDRRGANS